MSLITKGELEKVPKIAFENTGKSFQIRPDVWKMAWEFYCQHFREGSPEGAFRIAAEFIEAGHKLEQKRTKEGDVNNVQF